MNIPEPVTNEPDMNEQYPEMVGKRPVVENTELPEAVAELSVVEDTDKQLHAPETGIHR